MALKLVTPATRLATPIPVIIEAKSVPVYVLPVGNVTGEITALPDEISISLKAQDVLVLFWQEAINFPCA